MYKIMISGRDHYINAEGFSLEDGNIIFYEDKKATKIKLVVARDKWELFDLSSHPLAVPKKPAAPVPPKPKARKAPQKPKPKKAEK